MKKVIDCKVYDTDTAECIHEWDNGGEFSDVYRCSEKLFETKKGKFFIHGNGGAFSRYGKSNGNHNYAGSDIRTLSKSEAIEWLENHDGSDVLEELFPDSIEEG